MRCRVSYVQSCTHPCGRAQREALTAAKKNPAPLAAAPRKIAGAPSGDMKRDTGTKVYSTDADAKKTSYNHITSSLMRSSKVPASEEERDITKKTQNFEK